jgi:hypothetical protein
MWNSHQRHHCSKRVLIPPSRPFPVTSEPIQASGAAEASQGGVIPIRQSNCCASAHSTLLMDTRDELERRIHSHNMVVITRSDAIPGLSRPTSMTIIVTQGYTSESRSRDQAG